MPEPLTTLAYFIHDLDPCIFRLSPTAISILFWLCVSGAVISCAAMLLKALHKYVLAGLWDQVNRINGGFVLFLAGAFAAGAIILKVLHLAGWGPRWYGLAYLLGFLCAYLLLKKQVRDGMLRLKSSIVPDLVLNCCIFGILVGGRVGFCLFYEPSLLGFDPVFPWWGVLRVWQGGMSSHGGILFTILTLMVFAWRYYGRPTREQLAMLIGGTIVLGAVGWAAAYFLYHSPDVDQQNSIRAAAAMVLGIAWMTYYGWRQAIPMTNLGDAACMVAPIGLFFGRCANFINGELYGHPTSVPWAVKFPSEITSPTNGVIDEAVRAKLPGVFTNLNLEIDWFARPNEIMQQGLDALRPLLLHHDPQAVQAVASIIPARHPSQLYEALLEGALLFVICYTVGRKWKKDGMAGGAFVTFYPIMRIIGEQFRVGDAPLTLFGIQFSQGILYSLPMVTAGILYWVYWIWRDRPAAWVPAKEDAPQGQPGDAATTAKGDDQKTAKKQG